jgi:hypothetical protein
MKHFASASFWDSYHFLPAETQELADRSFDLLKENPQHPSLHLKKVGRYWSVRVGRRYRAIGIEMDSGILWFWIGTHSEYDRLVK